MSYSLFAKERVRARSAPAGIGELRGIIFLIFLSFYSKKQEELLPILKDMSIEFGLVGGTAIALQVGHRQSIDFDLFKYGSFDILKLKKSINIEAGMQKLQDYAKEAYKKDVENAKKEPASQVTFFFIGALTVLALAGIYNLIRAKKLSWHPAAPHY